MKKVSIISMTLVIMMLSLSSIVSAKSGESETINKDALYEKLGYTKENIIRLEKNPEMQVILTTNERTESKIIKNKDIKKAIEFGFTEQEISDFTEIDWNYLSTRDADLISVDEKYIAVTDEGTQEISKENALKEILSQKMKQSGQLGGISTLAVDIGSDQEQTSWMKVVTTVTKDTSQTPTAYYLKHSFEWLTEPFWNLEDGIAISHPEHMVQIQNSEIFKYTYDYHTNNIVQPYAGTNSVYKWTADNKGANGMAFKYDLLSRHYIGATEYIVKKNRGYMIFGVNKNSNQYSKGSAYGHYVHSEIAISFAIGVKVSLNSLSVTGALQTTPMTDTGVTFSW